MLIHQSYQESQAVWVVGLKVFFAQFCNTNLICMLYYEVTVDKK